MAKFFINVTHNTAPVVGWTASVAQARGAQDAPSMVAIGESEIYATKNQAWQTIQNRVANLNYAADEIFFNSQRVHSYADVLVLYNRL